MAVFLSSVSGVFIILVMVAIGYILNERGWFDEKSTRMISKLVTQIALPAYMVTTIMKDFTANELKTLLPDLRYPVISMLILFVFSLLITRTIHIKSEHKGLFQSMFLTLTRCLWDYRLTSHCLVTVRSPTCWCTIWPTQRFFGR
jgi:Predicted permeases